MDLDEDAMEPQDDDITASQQRAGTHEAPRVALPEEYLLRRIRALEDEVEVLRAAAAERRRLEDSIAQLREANEHLVLAAVDAQTSRDDAEDNNRRQNEFLAMLAHELRKFMTVVKVRGSDHSCDLREYTITADGIEVRPRAPKLNGIMIGRPKLDR